MMPRKPPYLSHNFNTEPPDNKTSNKLPSPWSSVTYGSQIDGHDNSFTNTNSGQSSLSNYTSQDYSLQSKNGCHKRKADTVVQISAQNHQYNTRNVKPHVQLPRSDSHSIDHGEGDTRSDLHIVTSSITDCCYKNATADQVAKPIETPPLAHDTNKQQETNSLPNVHHLSHHLEPQYSHPSLHRKQPFSAQSVHLTGNETEATHDQDLVADLSHQERLHENRSPKRLCQQSGKTTRTRTGGATHNVRQRLREDNLLNTFASSPAPVVEAPISLPNPAIHDQDLVADLSHQERLHENRCPKRLCQQSGQTTPTRTAGATQIDGDDNSFTNTNSGQSSLSNYTSQDYSLQSKNGCHKRKADTVVQISAQNHQYNTRNVKPHVQLPRSDSHSIDHGEGDTRSDLHISVTSSITDCCYKNATADQVAKPIETPPLAHDNNKQQETNSLPNVHHLSHHLEPQYSDPSLHRKRPFSAQSVHLTGNETEATHDQDLVADLSHQERLHENRSPKRLCQQSGKTTRTRTGGATHNVRQRLREDNLLNTFASSPAPVVEAPISLPNPAIHDQDLVADLSHQERLHENRCPKRLCQQSGQTTRTRTAGATHNVRQRLHANNLHNTFASSTAPVVKAPISVPKPDTTPSYEDLGDCDQLCRHYGAAFWYEERVKRSSTNTTPEYHLCCGQGRFIIDHQPDPPQYIKQLLSDRNFMDNIRAYNQMFAMTSFGATIDKSVNDGRGPYVFRISGQIYHWIGSLCPVGDNDTPRFLQLYIYDTKNEVQNRMSHFEPSEQATLDPEIVKGLINFFDAHNKLVQVLRTARDLCNETNIPEFKLKLYNAGKARGYELPTSDTIAAIVFDSGPESESNYDVIIQYKGGQPQRINKLHQSYMSLQFPLIFIYGEPGFHTGLTLKSADPTQRPRRVSLNAFYTYQLHPRPHLYDLLFRTGRLFQQYVVGVYCCIEQSRMDFYRKHQSDIRGDYLSGLYDAISRGDCDGSQAGSRIILPSSFTGGPRYMYSHYLDALAICRELGNPQFFITFTCNVNWPEIQRYMADYPQLTSSDRADMVCRVFEQKIKAFIHFLKNNRPFGYVTGVLYTIEFQKRGLPHCHTLVWITSSDKIQNAQDVDRYISAELPDPVVDPQGYKIVSDMMIHGPCGLANVNALCMEGTNCTKNFPKKYNDQTFFDSYGQVHYQRRQTQVSTTKRQMKLDNTYVVPYNRALCLAFEAHINVEYCGWSMLIKYLFKYISKGTDRIFAKVTRSIGETSSSSTDQHSQIDEIQNFQDGRFICPHEAMWRILNFKIHAREPAVQILSVHLENMQHITFRDHDNLESVVNRRDRKVTTLTEWFAYNANNEDGRHLTYLQFPSEFVWYQDKKMWQRRKTTQSSIGRLTYVHPSAGELFYFRMLLCHQKGCKGFTDVKKVNQMLYPTYRAACEALGLLGDDKEWDTALEEACFSASSSELRSMFVHILTYCEVVNPIQLWNKYWKEMGHDIPRSVSRSVAIRDYYVNDPELKDYILFELEVLFNGLGKSLKEFSLPTPPKELLHQLENRLLMEEKNYNREELKQEKEENVPKLNADQRQIYDLIMNAFATNRQELIFVYGHGGTGKTFLWKTVISALRSEGSIVLAVASSGIASLLLPAGRTAHSRFKLPLELTEETLCKVTKNTHLGKLLVETDLIIWDEAPMNDRRCFEALDRTLKDLLDTPEVFFGGKSIILGGDFRQTLPVKKGAPKMELIASSIANSYLWPYFRVLTLKQNMRLLRPDLSEEEKNATNSFASWLLDVGNGTLGESIAEDKEDASWIDIPTMYCIEDDDEGLLNLIQFIYDQPTLHTPSATILQQKAIVCPKNDTADLINSKVLSMVERDMTTYASYDVAIPSGNSGAETEMLYPAEHLNTFKFSGFPPHQLELKVGAPIMLLRNVNVAAGLCNGTRMIVTHLMSKLIEAQLITGTKVGEKVFIHRITLVHKDPNLPFIFKRTQFPIKLCYAMTINKSQGQSLNKIGIYLPEPIFSHGQLYVALSRATSPHGLKILIKQQENLPPNVTKNIVYKDFLKKIHANQL